MFKINIINFEDILYRLFTLGKRLMGASTSLVTYWNSVQINSSVIRAKGQISKPVFQENKERQNSAKNEHFLRTCAYQGIGNVRFSENLARSVFLKHPF